MNCTRCAHLVAAILLILGFAGRPASAGGLVMYVAGLGNEFGTLDLSNPSNITFQSLGSTGTELFGMGFTSNGNLYGAGIGNFASDLFQIDPASGSTTDLGPLGFPTIGATMGPDGTTMYEMEYGSYAPLYTLTPPSTNSMFVGSSLLDNGSDGLMAFSPTGTLYTDEFNNGNDILASVNTSTGAATLIGSGMGDYIFAGGFVDGTFFGFAPDGKVYTIDTSTGDATFYGNYSFGPGDFDYINAATADLISVPEPSSLVLMSIASSVVSMGSIFLRVRKSKQRR